MTPQQKFFETYAPFAVQNMEKTKIPASVTLAQAALESNWGKSDLSTLGKNFFGIKGTGPAGAKSMKTWEVIRGQKVVKFCLFRCYNSPLESFLDHSKVISTGRYLKHAMDHTESAKAFITALQSKPQKYATDTQYVEKILKIIKDYGLENYDKKGESK